MRRLPFITFEGSEGCGKSTQVQRLAGHLDRLGIAYLLTREPGGTPIGETIRELLQFAPHNSSMKPETELLLFEASRSQLVRETIKPALERGFCVIADRLFDSTTVYQSAARRLDRECRTSRANRIGWNKSLLTFMSVFAEDIETWQRANQIASC